MRVSERLWRLPWPPGRHIPGSRRWTLECKLWPPGCRSPWLTGTRAGLDTHNRHTSKRLHKRLNSFLLRVRGFALGEKNLFQYQLASRGYGFQTEEQSGISLCHGWFPARRQTERQIPFANWLLSASLRLRKSFGFFLQHRWEKDLPVCQWVGVDIWLWDPEEWRAAFSFLLQNLAGGRKAQWPRTQKPPPALGRSARQRWPQR